MSRENFWEIVKELAYGFYLGAALLIYTVGLVIAVWVLVTLLRR